MKTRPDAAPGEYAAEAAGLAVACGAAARCATPRVLELDERYLALEWIEPGRLDGAGAEELGRGLAATHAAGAPCFGDLGLGCGPRRASARCVCRTSPPRTGRRSTPSGACGRSPRMAGERRALSPAGQSARSSSVCERDRGARGAGRAAGPAARGSVGGQRDGRQRRAAMADRPVRLRRAPRGGPGDAEAVRGAVERCSRL